MKNRKSLTMLISAAFIGVFSASASAGAAPSNVTFEGPAEGNQVALTFDDRADGENVSSILQTLAEHDISATFFVTSYGDDAQIPYIQEIVAQGHQVANHSLNHNSYTQLTEAQIRADLNENQAFIENASGENTQPYFRPPYGDYNENVLQILGDEGYTETIMWSVDTLDWSGNSPDDIVQRVMNGIEPGGIVLMHTEGNASGTTEALPEIITNLDQLGYEFVTIEEMVVPQAIGSEEYIVQAGDSLSAIASQFGTTVDSIASENNIADPNFIYTGQQIMIPGVNGEDDTTEPSEPETQTYTVQPGDSLWAIANEHGVTVDEIVLENNISNPDVISVGQTLTLPGSEGGDETTSDEPDQEPETDTYTVEAGDTLWSIASAHNTTVDAIVSQNNISNPDFISVGQELEIN